MLILRRQRVRLQLHALAYNLGNFMRTLAMPKAAEPWSLTSQREKVIKIGAKVVSHGRYVTFKMAEVAVSRQMFAEIPSLIFWLRHRPRRHEGLVRANAHAMGGGRGMPPASKASRFSAPAAPTSPLRPPFAGH
jgi:hypothetical protein